MANFSCSNSPSTKQSWDCHHGHCHPSQLADQRMFMFHLVLLILSIRPPVKLFQVPGEMMVLPPKTYCLWQCWDMATILPIMQKEWGMSSKNILTVKVKLAGNGTNACNISIDIQEVNNLKICFKVFQEVWIYTWKSLTSSSSSKNWQNMCLAVLNEICTEIWKVCWLMWSNLRRLDDMLMPWTRKYFCKLQESVDSFYLILTGQLFSDHWQ